MEKENGNGNWRQEIRRLNLEYLNIVKQIGTMPEQRDYVQTVLRLDDDMLKLLMSLAAEELNKMADVGMPLFRLKLADLKIFQNLNQKGNADRATSLLSAALVADGAEEGKS